MTTIELDYSPHDYQKVVHSASQRFKLIVGGRRVGKSKMALMELIKHCISTPGAVAWWVAPTIAMAREVGWEELKEYKETLDPAIESIHETLLRVKFVNGSVLYFKGADNEKALRGRGLTYLVIDEAAFVDPEMWTRALRPALSDKNGQALLISTPNGRNWFYHAAAIAAGDPRWIYEHWPTWRNPLISEEEIKDAMASVSELDFRQEYMAEFVTREGMVYDNFSEENIIEPGSPSWHDWDIYLGIDFGYANPTAICFMAVDRTTEQIIQFDEIYIARTPIEQIERIIIDKLISHGLRPDAIRAIYTDPAGNAEELSSGISPVDHLRKSEFRWTVINKGSEIAPGIAMVRSYLLNANGQRRYFITTNCRETIRSLSGYTYTKTALKGETIKEEPLKDGLHDHMCDAIRYFFVNQFDKAKWLADKPEQWAYGVDMTGKGKVVMKKCQMPGCGRKFPSKTPKYDPPYICKACNGEL